MIINNVKRHQSHGDGTFKIEDFKQIGKNVIIEKGVMVFHPETIILHDNVYIGHYSIIKGYYKNSMEIGQGTWIGQNSFLHSGGGIRIGKAVGIGPYVKILTSYHIEESTDIPVMYNRLEFKKVIIEDGVDIGIGSIILPGIRIGERSIIGAGSVVTQDVGPYTVVAGSPAKLLRRISNIEK
jgi:acetyltransferase-like isoleucine patch superfamily enzyme